MKKTSEDGMVLEHNSSPPWAVLADFDIDGAALKKLHKEWLDDLVAAVKAKAHRTGAWLIDLKGRASRSGSDAHNLWLSNERLQTVETYVQSRIASSKAHFDRQALGEGDPQDPAAYENELDRSVAVKARFFPAPPEPRKIRLLIPKYNPWKPRKNRKVMDFTLQVLKAQIDIFTLDLKLPFASVGQGRAKVKLFIEIKELGTKDTAQYEFDGSGIGGIASAGFSIKKARPGLGLSSWSQTFEKGKKHRFATTTPMDADDFAGGALFEKSVRGRFSFNFGPVHGLLGASIKIPSLGLGKPTSPTSPFSLAECLVSAKMKQVTSTPSWAK